MALLWYAPMFALPLISGTLFESELEQVLTRRPERQSRQRCFGGCTAEQHICSLLESAINAEDVVICGSLQQGPLCWVDLVQLNAAAHVQRVESADGGSFVVLWLLSLSRLSACLQIELILSYGFPQGTGQGLKLQQHAHTPPTNRLARLTAGCGWSHKVCPIW